MITFSGWREATQIIDFVADFETCLLCPATAAYTKELAPCHHVRVWSWGLMEVDTEQYFCGNSIESFIHKIAELTYNINDSIQIGFHNLKFDGAYIVDYLLRIGYIHPTIDGQALKKVTKKTPIENFACLVTDRKQWHAIEISHAAIQGRRPARREKSNKIRFWDTAKLYPMPLRAIPETLGLPIEKGNLDQSKDTAYNKIRPEGYEPSEAEKEYQYIDCLILAKALQYTLLQTGLSYIKYRTQSSQAIHNLIGHVNDTYGDKWFDYNCRLKKQYDKFCRKAYKGGISLINPAYTGQTINQAGLVIDINSSYPARMAGTKGEILPIGNPILHKVFKSYDEWVKMHALFCNSPNRKFVYILKFHQITFKQIDSDYFICPNVQIKDNILFKPTEWLFDSHGIYTTYTFTQPDFEYFNQYYNWGSSGEVEAMVFLGQVGPFESFVLSNNDKKIQYKKEGNPALAYYYKVNNNSSYGKFGENPLKRGCVCGLDESGILTLTADEEETESMQTYHVAIAAFITAYARVDLARTINEFGNRFLYCDTDSIHALGTDIPKGIQIDKYRLGFWDLEKIFVRAKYIKPKTYLETDEQGNTVITCAGAPNEVKENMIKEENLYEVFKAGSKQWEGKLIPHIVSGGVWLYPTTFRIT